MTRFALIRWKCTLFCRTPLPLLHIVHAGLTSHSQRSNSQSFSKTTLHSRTSRHHYHSSFLQEKKNLAQKQCSSVPLSIWMCDKKTNSPYFKSGSCLFFPSSSVNHISQLSPGAVNGHLAKQIPCKRAPRLPSTSAVSSIRLLQLLSLRRLTFWTQTVELTQCWQTRL